MPTARSAVLAGRLVADTARMFLTTLIIVGVGYAVGFRFRNGFFPAFDMVVLATIFGLALCCAVAFTGLAIGDLEAVQAFGLVWLFPLAFVSSAFVPVQTMPGWLQAFASSQPVTIVINTMRALALGGPVADSIWKSPRGWAVPSSCSSRWPSRVQARILTNCVRHTVANGAITRWSQRPSPGRERPAHAG
jgi:ABC transporter DrrB family efflux protein